LLASTVISSALGEVEPDVTDMVIAINTRLEVRGAGSVEIHDQLFSAEGLSSRLLAQARGTKALADLLGNPFEPAVIERIGVEIRVEVPQRRGRDCRRFLCPTSACGRVRPCPCA